MLVPFFRNFGERIEQIRHLILDDLVTDRSIRARLIPSQAHSKRKVQQDCSYRRRTLGCQGQKALAGFRLNIGGIDYGESSTTQTFGRDQPQQLERIRRGALIAFVVGNHGS